MSKISVIKDKIVGFVKKEVVLSIAIVAMVVTMFFVPDFHASRFLLPVFPKRIQWGVQPDLMIRHKVHFSLKSKRFLLKNVRLRLCWKM
jgi:hypothetical protein